MVIYKGSRREGAEEGTRDVLEHDGVLEGTNRWKVWAVIRGGKGWGGGGTFMFFLSQQKV